MVLLQHLTALQNDALFGLVPFQEPNGVCPRKSLALLQIWQQTVLMLELLVLLAREVWSDSLLLAQVHRKYPTSLLCCLHQRFLNHYKLAQTSTSSKSSGLFFFTPILIPTPSCTTTRASVKCTTQRKWSKFKSNLINKCCKVGLVLANCTDLQQTTEDGERRQQLEVSLGHVKTQVFSHSRRMESI